MTRREKAEAKRSRRWFHALAYMWLERLMPEQREATQPLRLRRGTKPGRSRRESGSLAVSNRSVRDAGAL